MEYFWHNIYNCKIKYLRFNTLIVVVIKLKGGIITLYLDFIMAIKIT